MNNQEEVTRQKSENTKLIVPQIVEEDDGFDRQQSAPTENQKEIQAKALQQVRGPPL